MTRELYVSRHCPSEPVLMMSEHYDQRADDLISGGRPSYPGETVLAVRAHAAKLRREGRDIPLAPLEGDVFMHAVGPRDATVVCSCGHWADFLCDTPLGRGRTCDRPMCYCCRDRVGDDLDRCPYHKATVR